MKEIRTRLGALLVSVALGSGAVIAPAPAMANTEPVKMSSVNDARIIDCTEGPAQRDNGSRKSYLTDSSLIDFFFGLTTNGIVTDDNGCNAHPDKVQLSIITPVLAILGFGNWLKKKDII
ncbi:MAG: hypothetical protein SPK00_00625 [Corynebacterium glucuronolyticum]|nr:hypothetical protein [Corynebacterium glucuronolyticum]MDD7585963.1 hypothetical protein [Mycobacteriaceae bacterium]MDY5833255.1 hypothetical protein [Corynebacterium glucuronolyticum]